MGVGKVRRLQVKLLWAQRLVNNGQTIVPKVKGDDSVADIGAKPLAMKTFEQHRRRLGLGSGPYEFGLSSGLCEPKLAELAMSSG